jgi:hypothetical protein
MPKNIVATPAAVVAVDRLTLQADDARGDVPVEMSGPAVMICGTCSCFSEE